MRTKYLINLVKQQIKKLLHCKGPDFLIIGAQKSGTSSLFYYLNQHPDIVGSKVKEVRFFNRDDYYRKGFRWYYQFFKPIIFSDLIRPKLYFEATPEYLYRESALQRIYQYNPKLKLIIVLREPVKRAYSAWNMYKSFLIEKEGIPSILQTGYIEGKENNLYKELYADNSFPSFQACVEAEMIKIIENSSLEEPSFIRRGIYHTQISKVFSLFEEDKVLILGFKELIEHRTQSLNKILNFLGLPPSSWSFIKEEIQNQRDYQDKIDPDVEKSLKDFYESHNRKLFEVLNKNINW